MTRLNTLRRLAFAFTLAGALATTAMPSFAGRDVATGQAGGGNCSLWQVIKSAMSGVDCRFL